MLAKLGGPTEKAVKTGIFHLQSWLEGQGKLCPGPRAKDTIYTWPDLWREVPEDAWLQISSLSQPISHCEEASAPALSPPWTNQVKMNRGKGHEGTEAGWGRAWLSKEAEGQQLACACVLFLSRQARVNAPFIP